MRHFWLRFFSPERSLARFIVGTAALTVVIQFIYDLTKDRYGIKGAAALALLLVVVVVAILWLDYRLALRQVPSRPQETPVTPHKGLILLISPHRKELPLMAIEHHKAALRYCWLLASRQSLETAEDLVADISVRYPEVNVLDVQETMVDPESIESTFDTVNCIYEKMADGLGLSEQDIVADITGGQKPMTAGMAVACFSPQRKMQYMKVVRDLNGEPVIGASPVPVLVNKVPAKPA